MRKFTLWWERPLIITVFVIAIIMICMAYMKADGEYERVKKDCVKTELMYWHGGWKNTYDCKGATNEHTR